MKKIRHISFFYFLLVICLTSCKSQKEVNDSKQIVKNQTIHNPILSGFYPDPSITKAGEDYYIVTSSFSYFPGLPIFHSKDLANWNQIGHAIHRNEQMNFIGQGVSRGLFAPAIEYHDGLFYVICTQVDRLGNFIVTAEHPAGPWSDPYLLPEVSGIDPSLFFDDATGKAWIVYNSEPPNNKPLYSGHRSIKQIEFDLETMKTVGEPEIIVNGGVDLDKEPVWIEAPHLYHINDYYYLMCAEGGTSWNHSEVVFRSQSPTGPFKPWEKNPILTQRHLEKSRKNPIEVAGHADMVQTNGGEWWAVFLAVRPYKFPYFNIGRETFIAPVEWTEDNWPVINPDFEEIQYSYPAPNTAKTTKEQLPLSGNFSYKDEFEDSLHMSWTYLRNPQGNWHTITSKGLEIKTGEETVSDSGNPHFLAKRQQYHNGSTEMALTFHPKENEQAGLLIFQNETHYYFLCKEGNEEKQYITLYKHEGNSKEQLATRTLEQPNEQLRLKLIASGQQLTLQYAEANKAFRTLAEDVDATILSTETAGGFVGVMQGPYATSNHSPTNNKAVFHYFQMTVDEPIFQDKN